MHRMSPLRIGHEAERLSWAQSFWTSYLMPTGWSDLGLAMASEGVQPTNSPCPVVATELMFLVIGSVHLQSAMGCRSWGTANLPLLVLTQMGCPSPGTLWMLWRFRALGAEPKAHPCDCTECRTLIISDLANTVSRHYLPGQTSISSLLQWLWVICGSLAF